MEITPDKLKRALENKFGLDNESAEEISYLVFNLFGFDDEVQDYILDRFQRQIFYDLQDVGFLRTRTEESYLHTGRPWRTIYWYFNVEEINKAQEPEEKNFDVFSSIYNSLPEAVWYRG